MKIIKGYVEREGYYDFYLKDENQVLKIFLGDTLDLYWTIHEFNGKDKNLTSEEIRKEIYDESKYIFTITKENYFIYSLFEELYDDIKESRIFLPTKPKEDGDYFDTDEEIELDLLNYMNEDETYKENERHKKLAAYQMLFDGEIIEWHSDDDMYHRADRVIIKKGEETFVLEFTRPGITEDNFMYHMPGSVIIRFKNSDNTYDLFRNSGSTYNPYNIIFMRMFNKLQEYDPKYHQIHIEELSYQKKLTLKK